MPCLQVRFPEIVTFYFHFFLVIAEHYVQIMLPKISLHLGSRLQLMVHVLYPIIL